MSSSTNERQVRARQEQMKRDRLTDEMVIKHLMGYPDGRRWVWLRLGEAQIFAGDEALEPYRMAFDKGRRNSGLRLLADVNKFCPEEYILMQNEAQTIEANITKKDPNYVRTEYESDSGQLDLYPADPALN